MSRERAPCRAAQSNHSAAGQTALLLTNQHYHHHTTPHHTNAPVRDLSSVIATLYSFQAPYIMGNQQSNIGGGGAGGDGGDDKSKKDKPKYEPPPQPTRLGRKKRKAAGPNAAAKLPTILPTARCKLRYLRMQRIHDHLLLEEEYVENQERIRKAKAQATAQPSATGDLDALDRNADERGRVDDMRGSPMGVGNLEEMIDDDHAIVSSATGPEYYVSIMSFVDKDLLEPGASILLHHKSVSVVGVLTDDTDPLVSVMKLDKAPTESYADIGGLESQIQEVREAVELPLLHPELYEEMGIKPPKGVILYGGPGTGKTLLAKAVANQTSATFLRIVGSELIQKYLGDGPRLVRQIFQVAAEHAPSIVFIDEIDAIGTKRYDSTSGGEREIQRTMLELLNQLDGFDDRGDVKVIMATNKIDSLDPALIRPGRIDRKILFENPDLFPTENTKRKIFTLHTGKMSLSEDVDLDEFISQKDDLSGADIKAICSEAGLMALRERRMRVQMEDFRTARERVLKTKSESEPEGLYL
ncbi:26S protease regulatory subunit 4-like protein [Talaromyces atroroseus]|uniref:26S proteasome regulatory subunit 4 homolog n=1 Tax=Talaromyces atroroseus TaxID=1441469 RepID=A0A225AF11_TALAT|nr:26S protease regulatory subunit 4-like protein [Talaromyces atroroseus]OKL57683.1 26S protease regulatory subunit 4-like protein [Talaromyces atroroseus]